jgi:ribokinase
MAKVQPRIVVVGSLVFDLVVQAERRPAKGETLLGTDFGMFPGGKGANQAVQAARLGAIVTMVGRVGGDFFGRALLDSLQETGVDSKFVVTDTTTTTAVGCIIVDKEGDNSIVVVPQANMRCTTTDVDRAMGAIDQADILLLQLEIPMPVVEYAAAAARSRGVLVILNPAPAQDLPKGLLRQVDLITPNETELARLTGQKISGIPEYQRAAASLLQLGPRAVVVTLGDQGALLVNADGARLFPAPSVQAVDTTAAGDAFTGGLAVSLAEGASLPEAIQFANRVGALTVTRRGAQPSLPRRCEVAVFGADG